MLVPSSAQFAADSLPALSRYAYALTGDEAMRFGLGLFYRTLAEYLAWFAGRAATRVIVSGPPVADWEQAWSALRGALGLSGPARPGQPARLTVPGLADQRGVVYFANPHTLGVRTQDGLYRFLRGFRGPMIASHHLFSDVDPQPVERAWRSWLDTLST